MVLKTYAMIGNGEWFIQYLKTVLVRVALSKRGGGMEEPRVGGGRVVPRLEYTEQEEEGEYWETYFVEQPEWGVGKPPYMLLTMSRYLDTDLDQTIKMCHIPGCLRRSVAW